MLPVTPLSRNEVLDSSHQGASGLTPDTSSVNVSRHSMITKPVQFEDGATCKECIHRMDVDKNTWLVGVQFATYIPNNSNVQSGRLNWEWETNREYAECYNLAECDMPIEIREKRGDRTQFSISTATHDVLQTLDGYDDSGN